MNLFRNIIANRSRRREIAALLLAAVLILLSACDFKPPADGGSLLTPDQEPLATETPTVAPSQTPETTSAITLPTANPDTEGNLYVLGVYISKPAYVESATGNVMLPMQETLAVLGIDYTRNSTDNRISLDSGGKTIAEVIFSESGQFELVMSDEELAYEGALLLQIKGGVVFAPSAFFEFIAEVDCAANKYGDIFLHERPEPTPEPTTQPDEIDGDTL